MEEGLPGALPALERPAYAKFAQLIFEDEHARASHAQSAVVGGWTTSSPSAQGGMGTHPVGPGCLGGFTDGVNAAPTLCASASPSLGFGLSNNAFGVGHAPGAFHAPGTCTPVPLNSAGAGVQAAGQMAFGAQRTPLYHQHAAIDSPHFVQQAHRPAVPVRPH